MEAFLAAQAAKEGPAAAPPGGDPSAPPKLADGVVLGADVVSDEVRRGREERRRACVGKGERGARGGGWTALRASVCV